MPAGVRAANASAARTPGNRRFCARSVSRRRAENEEGAHGPVEHVREVRVRAAGSRTSPACASCQLAIHLHAVRLRPRAPGSRGTPGSARVPAPPRARGLSGVGRILRIGHHLRLAAREATLNGARREA
jgi:hypothetical protein